mgnify:FL=1
MRGATVFGGFGVRDGVRDKAELLALTGQG